MNAEEKRRASEIMDPDEFKRLLDQFGKEAMAKAEAKGRSCQRDAEDHPSISGAPHDERMAAGSVSQPRSASKRSERMNA
jgi:hypothetical protein